MSYLEQDDENELIGKWWYDSHWTQPDSTAKAIKLCQQVTEALHQNLDGWSTAEQRTIRAFLYDTAMAAEADKTGP